MRRRRKHHAVSLFAFQDVMASVIGVLFFVVLLMSLHIMDRSVPVAAAGQQVVPLSRVEALQARLRYIEAEIAKLRESIRVTSDKVRLASRSEGEILSKIEALRNTLTATYRSIEQYQANLAELEGRADEKELKKSSKAAELARAKDRLAKLALELANIQAAPRVSYIIEASADNLEPWLVEVRANAIRVAARDGRTSLVSFAGKAPDATRKMFLAWAGAQNCRTHYFVLLIKPSGMKLAEKIGAAVTTSGFQIGTDLVPETWQLFD